MDRWAPTNEDKRLYVIIIKQLVDVLGDVDGRVQEYPGVSKSIGVIIKCEEVRFKYVFICRNALA